MIRQLATALVLLVSFHIRLSTGDPCRYVTDHGTIDISSIGKSDGTAIFPNIATTPTVETYKYSYNPCKPFSQGADCQNVAGCQIANDEAVRYSVGTQDSAKWTSPLSGDVFVTYTAGEKTLRVTFECLRDGQDPEFQALGEDLPNQYKFRLRHQCACWNGCSAGPVTTTGSSGGGGGGGGGEGGIGGGAIFIILLLVFFFVYFVGFALFYRFQQQKSGLELVPHRTFWSSLPGYARDGAKFSYGKVTGKGGDNYQSV